MPTVIYVPTKVIRCGISVLFKDLFFHKTNKQVSIVGTHFSSHSCNTYLLVMLTIKGKIVEELEQFINYVNNFHPALQFTWEISETSVSLLDILISINGNRLVTSVFYKPTDSHSYLLYSSSHPNHTKRSIPFSQFLLLRRLCSEDEDFHAKSLEMRDFFVQHSYPTSLLDTAFSKASQIPDRRPLPTL